MTDFSKRLALLLGLILLLLGSAFLIPTVIASTEDPQIILAHQEENIVYTVKSPLTSTVTNVNNSSYINLVLYNEETRDSTRITEFEPGTNITVTLSGESITVFYEEFITTSNIVIGYEIPVYFNWPEGAQTIFDNIGFIMLFTIVLFIIGILLIMIGGYK